jgi:Cu/Ag efflux pump CusA
MLVPGVGSQIYRGLATVIIGGMALSAVFTLVLIPSVLRLPPVLRFKKAQLAASRLRGSQGVAADA